MADLLRRRADELRAIAAEHLDLDSPMPPEIIPLVRLATEVVLREVAEALEEEGL